MNAIENNPKINCAFRDIQRRDETISVDTLDICWASKKSINMHNLIIESNIKYESYIGKSQKAIILSRKIDKMLENVRDFLTLTIKKILPAMDLLSPLGKLTLKSGAVADGIEIGKHSYVYVNRGSAHDTKVENYVFVFLVNTIYDRSIVGNFAKVSCMWVGSEYEREGNRKFIKFQVKLLNTLKSTPQYKEMKILQKNCLFQGSEKPVLMNYDLFLQDTKINGIVIENLGKYQESMMCELNEFNNYLDKL